MFKYFFVLFLTSQVFSQTISCQFGEIKLEIDSENNFKQTNVFSSNESSPGRIVKRFDFGKWIYFDGEYIFMDDKTFMLEIDRDTKDSVIYFSEIQYRQTCEGGCDNRIPGWEVYKKLSGICRIIPII